MQSFRDALAAARETGNRSHEASLINFIGLIHQFTGDIPAAIANYDHALSLARDLGDRKTESVALYHLGWVNFLRRDWTLSAQWYERSLAVAREIGDAASEARNLTGLGRTFHASGEYQRALTVDGEALELSRRTGDRQAEAEALDNLGIALTFLGRPDEAVERHRQSMQIRTAGGETWARTMTLSGLARALQAAGRIEEASEAMSQIVEMLDAGRRRLSARRYKAAFSSFAWGHYARAIELRMALGDANGAVSLSERARARLTLDAVQQSLAGSGSPDAALFSREDALRDAIERMERQRDTGPSVQASTTGERIEALRAELEEVGSQIHRAFPALDNARHAEPLGVDALRSELLSGGTALLEYFLGPERSYVWVVTHDSVVYRELPSRQAIEAEAAKLHQLLAAGDQRATRRTVAKALESFSRQILPPLPAAAGKLIIVPDGALFHVPFAALSEGGTPLVDRFEIVLAPSASAVALLLRRDPKTGSGIAVFADPVFRADDPRIAGAKSGAGAARSKRDSVRSAASRSEIAALPRLFWSRAEADDIVRLTSGRAVKALDFEASRRRLLSEDLSRYRILHFATHALVDGSSPEQSGIVLSMVDSRGRPVDGFLRVHDLYGLSGAPGLVVLSACRTALGGEVRGEGIVGLVSGFMNAGTPRVVASYWNVKDRATKEMMQRFYAGVFERGMAPAAALRAAQKSMRADPRWMAPYYWASFALYGAP